MNDLTQFVQRRPFTTLLMVFLFWFFFGRGCIRAQAAWGPLGCVPVGTAETEDGYEWRKRADDPERLYLFRRGVQIGGYDLLSGQYRLYNSANNTWGAIVTAPIATPPRIRQNFGVETERLSGEPRYVLEDSAGTHELTRSAAHDLVSSKLEDDTGKLRITVIGPAEDRKRVVQDLTAKLPDIANWAIVRDYPPDHWAVAESFVTSGKPTIYCQAPAGQVLHRQDGYEGGIDALATALRKAKNYDPKKDPDLRQPASPFKDIDLVKLAPYALCLAAGLGVGLVFLRKGSS